MLDCDPCVVFIKTYCFESGLFYLADSLRKDLEAKGFKVYLVPKLKYVRQDVLFEKTYPEPAHPEDFATLPILKMNTKEPLEQQVSNHITKYDAKYILSFETLMEKAAWLATVKRKKRVKVIDIPMIEWVTPSYVENKSYSIFDEIWLFHGEYRKYFPNYPTRIVSWKFTDLQHTQKSNDKVIYHHFASTNIYYSTKNTSMVISAFLEATKNLQNVKLVLTGKLTAEQEDLCKKNANKLEYKDLTSRNDVLNCYREAHCVLAPSFREGLGLTMYESLAAGCKLITTDAFPMNIHQAYKCKVDKYQKERSYIPKALVNERNLVDQIKQSYKDIVNEQGKH